MSVANLKRMAVCVVTSRAGAKPDDWAYTRTILYPGPCYTMGQTVNVIASEGISMGGWEAFFYAIGFKVN